MYIFLFLKYYDFIKGIMRIYIVYILKSTSKYGKTIILIIYRH